MNRKTTLPMLFASILIATLCMVRSEAQVIAELTPSTWTVSSHTDETNNQAYNQASVVELTARTFAWGPESSRMLELNIDSESGSWDKESGRGQIRLTVSAAGDTKGTVTIEGTGEGISILLDLTFANGSSRIKLKISTVNYQ